MKKAKFWLVVIVVAGLTALSAEWVNAGKEGGEGIILEEKAEKAPAAEPGIAVEECPATFGPLVTDTAIPAAKGEFAIQPTWLVPVTYGSFDRNWKCRSAGGDFVNFTQLVKFTYGLRDNLEVFLELTTYTHNWACNVAEPGPGGETSADFGG
ncbi:MAG: transporter, partial [Deltaproteobacteria bacterium]|nr:transporter [Deltaproteobacteria bacterium]